MAKAWLVGAAYGALAASGALAAEPFDGRWAADLSACVAEDPVSPLVVTSRSLIWPGAACMVATSYRVGDAWHVSANCWGEGATRNVAIKLRMRGDRLLLDWAGARSEELRRC